MPDFVRITPPIEKIVPATMPESLAGLFTKEVWTQILHMAKKEISPRQAKEIALIQRIEADGFRKIADSLPD